MLSLGSVPPLPHLLLRERAALTDPQGYRNRVTDRLPRTARARGKPA